MSKDYWVPIDDDATPEETLLDDRSGFSNIERPIGSRVFRGIFWAVAVLLGVVFLATIKLNVVDHARYADLAFQNRSANFSIPPPRGVIFDRSGNALVKNIPSFDVIGVSKNVKSALAEGHIDLSKLGATLGLTSEALRAALAKGADEANIFFLATNVSKEQVLAIQSQNPAGVYVIPDAQRLYIDGPAFSSIVGYVGKVNKEDIANDPYYAPTDTVGRLGIEAGYEAVLRGEHGRIFFGDTSNTINVDAQNGSNLVLNIDADLQRYLYTEMRGILAGGGLSRGAAIIQNPQTGAVLAMVSLPSFDNNQFVDGLSQKEYDSIFLNSARPLFNRIISGLYNPGSTIKPLMGLMGLEEKVITPQTTIRDCVSLSIPNPFSPGVVYTFKNWRADFGLFNLRRAIADSCNIYFFAVGGGHDNIVGLGIQKMVNFFKKSLVDTVLGIDLPSEQSGFVPTPEWKEETRGESWYQGDTYNTSIGQGDLLVTPLWLNSYVAAIANGGTLYQPQVANSIVDNDKKTLQSFMPREIGQLPFSAANLNEVKNNMAETVLSGTAQSLKDLPVTAGAKTGTAEVVKGRSINSLFTAFAPLEHPQLAITVLVEGSASNEGLATRIARNALQWYFARLASASQ